MVINKKHTLFLSLLVVSFMVLANEGDFEQKYASEQKYKTKNYELVITTYCPQGEVSCDKVTLFSKDLTNNYSIQLKGKTLSSKCPDLCNFVGYVFKKENYYYEVVLAQGYYYSITNFDTGETLVNEDIVDAP